MDREEVLDYIEIAAENRIKNRTKHCIEESYDYTTIKKQMDYYEQVMEYVRENLK